MSSYLHISTRVTITAPIRTWEQLHPIMTNRLLATEIACRVEEDKTRMRKAKQSEANPHPQLYSWDYNVPVTIDNLTQEQEAAIRKAWEAR